MRYVVGKYDGRLRNSSELPWRLRFEGRTRDYAKHAALVELTMHAKMPTAIQQKWLAREESDTGFLGSEGVGSHSWHPVNSLVQEITVREHAFVGTLG